MSKSNENSLEKNLNKNILSKELNDFKTKSKSPSLATSADSPKSNTYKTLKKQRKPSDLENSSKVFFPITNNKNDFLTLKPQCIEKPFIPNFKQNLFSIQNNNIDKSHSLFNTDINKNSNSYVKIRGKITVNNNKISNYTKANIKANIFTNNNNIFTNSFIDNDIYDTFLESISKSSSNSNSNSPLNGKENNKNIQNVKNDIDLSSNVGNNLDILDVKEKIIIESLIDLNKNNFCPKEKEIDVYEFDLEDYYFNKKYKNIIASYSSEEDLEFEKNVYEFIDNRIKLYYKSFKNTKPHILEEKKNDIKKFNNEINKILMYEKKVPNYHCLGFKSIIMSLFSLIIDLLSNNKFLIPFHKIHHQLSLENLPFDSDNNYLIFIDLITKYNKINEICPYIEKDFKDIIQNFFDEIKMQIPLSDIFTDLFWDHVFKNNNINHKFVNVYLAINIKKNLSYEKSKDTMDKIIDILINCKRPYKKVIGQIFHLPYMNKENIFLMNYILKYKKKYNYDIEEENIDIKEKQEIDINSNINQTSNLKEISNKNNNNNNNIENNNEVINNVKSKNNENNKNTDNFSLEEMYNYIQNDENDLKNKKKSKKHKKRKKKNNEKENEEENVEIDPVVEEFIQYFNDYYQKNKDCIKIKPIISKEWIESIT